MTDAPAFRRGADAAEEAAASAGGTFARTHFFKMEDKGREIIRVVTDAPDWIVVDQYGFLPTKPKPQGYDGNWPTHMTAVSRSDPALKGMFEDDFVAEHMRKPDGKPYKPSPRTWALACMREEVIGDGSEELGGPDMKGKRLGFRDQTREVTRKKPDSDETETTIEKAIVVLNMGYKNFFSALDGFYRTYGTLLDRDYVVMRKGEGTATQYQIAPLDPIGHDLRDPETAAKYKTDLVLEEVILGMASDDYYGRFFDTRVTVTTNKDGESSGAPSEQQTKPDTDVSPEKMRAIADRVKDYSPDAAAAEAAPAPEAQSAPPGAVRNFE